jgi:hypothetical protein
MSSKVQQSSLSQNVFKSSLANPLVSVTGEVTKSKIGNGSYNSDKEQLQDSDKIYKEKKNKKKKKNKDKERNRFDKYKKKLMFPHFPGGPQSNIDDIVA